MGIIANFARARVSHGDLGSKRQGVSFSRRSRKKVKVILFGGRKKERIQLIGSTDLISIGREERKN